MFSEANLYRVFYFSVIATIVAIVIEPTEVTRDADSMASSTKLVACDFEVFGIVQGRTLNIFLSRSH